MTKWSVGIDVTAQDIRMICLTKKGESYQLFAHAVVKRGDEEGMKKLLHHPAMHRGTTRFSIHDGTIKIRKITTPVVPKEELEEVIKWSLKEAIKVPVEGHILRYYPMSGAEEKKQSYLVLAIERGKLQDHLIELQKIGISQPQMIEPHMQALANCVEYNYDLKQTDRYAIITLDNALAYFAVISAEGLLFYRTFSGVTASASADQKQLFPKLGVEIQYSCENYLTQFPNQSISSAILSGDGIYLPGLKEHIEETLRVPTGLLEVFKKIDAKAIPPAELTHAAAYYGIATGLAL